MNIDPWILSFSAATVIATIFMGFWAARRSKTASDFFVAGRSVSVGWNASAISGEYLSAASFMGVAGMVMSSGYDALWYPVCYACGYLFLLLFIAGPLRRFGAYTIPDFAEGRYDSPIFRKIAVIFVMFIGFFYTMPQMKGAGTTLAYIFPGLPYWVGVALVGAVITLNVALGGMKGITLIQAFQYWAKMFAISVPIFVLMSVYGHYGKQLEVNKSDSVRASSQIWFNPENFPANFEKIPNGTKTYPSTTAEIRIKAARFGLGEVPIPSPDPAIPLIMLVSHYLSCFPDLGDSRPAMYFEKPISYMAPIDTSKFLLPATLTAAANRHYFEDIFATNGLTFVKISSDAIAFVRTENISKYVQNNSVVPVVQMDRKLKVNGPSASEASSYTSIPSGYHKLDVDAAPVLNPSGESGGLTTMLTVAQALNKYAIKSGKTIWVAPAVTNLWRENATTNPALDFNAPQSSLLSGLEDFLKFEGIELRDIENEQLLAIPVENGSGGLVFDAGTLSLRKPLPEKAPTDAKWISPFGPLTTKAAAKAGLNAEEQKPFSLLYTYSLIIALVCGTAGLPHILVRFYTNPDGVAAKRTTMWVMILIGVFYVFPPVFGVMGRNLLPELYLGAGSKGTDKIVLELPRILNERVPMLGSILSGITCAGAFAAFMSTFSGLLVSMTGALAHDVYGRILRPKSTPEQRMRMFKFGAVLIGAVAILLGMQVEQLEINFMVGQAFAIAAASYFPLLFMSVWWRGMTQKGAATGMLTGGFLALIGITLTSVSDIALKNSVTKGLPNSMQALESFWIAHPGIRILCEQPAIWAVPLAITLMIVVSKLTRKEIPSDVRMKMLVLHAPEKLGLKQEYIQEHQGIGH